MLIFPVKPPDGGGRSPEKKATTRTSRPKKGAPARGGRAGCVRRWAHADGLFMRRSRALVAFGGLVAVLVVGTANAHSQATARSTNTRPGAVFAWSRTAAAPELLSALRTPRTHDAGAYFGSFMRPGAPSDGLASDDACPPDMVGVEGDYCPLVAQTCLRWLDDDTKLQCAEFDRTNVDRASASDACSMKTRHKRFCVDRYEWPNKVSALPRTMASWGEARASCEGAGKRLCSDTEWTLACEGPARHPYPYGDGYVRDDRACNIDQPYILPNPERLYDPKTHDEELARLDQREASGSRPSCVSPYGVHDMVGNVDEWVYNESQFGKPYRSALKGGYWGPVRTRCRPMTTAHDEVFRYYQIGFRCCSEAHAVDSVRMPLAKR